MIPYVIAEVKMILRLRKQAASDEGGLSAKVIQDMFKSILEPDEELIEFECLIQDLKKEESDNGETSEPPGLGGTGTPS